MEKDTHTKTNRKKARVALMTSKKTSREVELLVMIRVIS